MSAVPDPFVYKLTRSWGGMLVARQDGPAVGSVKRSGIFRASIQVSLQNRDDEFAVLGGASRLRLLDKRNGNAPVYTKDPGADWSVDGVISAGGKRHTVEGARSNASLALVDRAGVAVMTADIPAMRLSSASDLGIGGTVTMAVFLALVQGVVAAA